MRAQKLNLHRISGQSAEEVILAVKSQRATPQQSNQCLVETLAHHAYIQLSQLHELKLFINNLTDQGKEFLSSPHNIMHCNI
jgi:hypothetical protein